MATILRQIVAGPRVHHAEAGLDLCYLTDDIIVTSGPSTIWPRKAYRSPLDQLVKFLDQKHHDDWSIFELRAEGTGYPDSEVYNRIHHFPWPDHHPPPFAIIPLLTASMRSWIHREDSGQGPNTEQGSPGTTRVAVVHCKAGKGRSGTASCAYLISEEGWTKAKALQQFTEKRMRAGCGAGVSIPSQLRWVHYVDRWTNEMNKQYLERPVELVELHILGLRDCVKVSVRGYVADGRQIQTFHTFEENESIVMDKRQPSPLRPPNLSESTLSASETGAVMKDRILATESNSLPAAPSSNTDNLPNGSTSSPTSSGSMMLLKPATPILLPTSDVSVSFVRRNMTAYTSWTMVSSVAHVWFNAYFEGGQEGSDSGVFEIDWEAMDGIKGSARKGAKAFDRLKVVWQYASEQQADTMARSPQHVVTQPSEGEEVPQLAPADWRGQEEGSR